MAARSAGAARWGVLTKLALALRTAVRPGSPGLAARAAAVPRMLRATARGEYSGLTWTHLAALAGALLYVVSPVDLMPEAVLAVFGLADDAVLVTWIAAALIADTEQFLSWERRPNDAPMDSSGQHWRSAPQDAPAAAYATVGSHVVR